MNLVSKNCRDGLSLLWNQFIHTLLENMTLVVWNHPTACHLQILKLIMTESLGHCFSLCVLPNVRLAYQIDLPSHCVLTELQDLICQEIKSDPSVSHQWTSNKNVSLTSSSLASSSYLDKGKVLGDKNALIKVSHCFSNSYFPYLKYQKYWACLTTLQILVFLSCMMTLVLVF